MTLQFSRVFFNSNLICVLLIYYIRKSVICLQKTPSSHFFVFFFFLQIFFGGQFLFCHYGEWATTLCLPIDRRERPPDCSAVVRQTFWNPRIWLSYYCYVNIVAPRHIRGKLLVTLWLINRPSPSCFATNRFKKNRL